MELPRVEGKLEVFCTTVLQIGCKIKCPRMGNFFPREGENPYSGICGSTEVMQIIFILHFFLGKSSNCKSMEILEIHFHF